MKKIKLYNRKFVLYRRLINKITRITKERDYYRNKCYELS